MLLANGPLTHEKSGSTQTRQRKLKRGHRLPEVVGEDLRPVLPRIDRIPDNTPHENPSTDLRELNKDDDEYRLRLHWFMHDLFGRMRGNYPEVHPFLHLFEYILKPNEDNYIAHVADLERLKAALVGLSEKEQRRAFNGWTLDVDVPDVQGVFQLRTDQAVDHLVVYPRSVTHGRERGCVAQREWMFVGDTEPVTVSIQLGAHKIDVIRGLEQMIDFIRLEWDQMITSDGFYKETGTMDEVKILRDDQVG